MIWKARTKKNKQKKEGELGRALLMWEGKKKKKNVSENVNKSVLKSDLEG